MGGEDRRGINRSDSGLGIRRTPSRGDVPRQAWSGRSNSEDSGVENEQRSSLFSETRPSLPIVEEAEETEKLFGFFPDSGGIDASAQTALIDSQDEEEERGFGFPPETSSVRNRSVSVLSSSSSIPGAWRTPKGAMDSVRDLYGDNLLDIHRPGIVGRVVVRREYYHRKIISRLLTPHYKYNPAHSPLACTLVGTRGMGKSTIALNFVEYLRNEKLCSHCWVLSCSSPEMLKASYIKLGKEKAINIQYNEGDSYQSFVAEVHRKIDESDWGKPWFIIYDGVDRFNLEDELGSLPRLGGSVLITTHNRCLAVGETISVTPMKVKQGFPNKFEHVREAIGIIEKITGEALPEGILDEDLVKEPLYELANKLLWHPLIISRVSAHIRDKGISVAAYLAQGKLDDIFSESALEPNLPCTAGKGARGGSKVNKSEVEEHKYLKVLKRVMADMTTEIPASSRQFLEMCSGLDSLEVPVDWIPLWIEFLRSDSGSDASGLIDEKVMREGVRKACVTMDALRGEDHFMLHGADRYALRGKDADGDRQRALRFLVFLAKELSWKKMSHWKLLHNWIEHAMSLHQKSDKFPERFPIDDFTHAVFHEKMGEHWYHIGLHKEAVLSFSEALSLYQDLQDIGEMRIYVWLGKAYRYQSRQREAIQNFASAIGVDYDLSTNSRSYEYIRAQRNLAMVYYSTNQEDLALKHIREAYRCMSDPSQLTPDIKAYVVDVLSTYALLLTSYTKYESEFRKDLALDQQELKSCLCRAKHKDKLDLADCLSKQSVEIAWEMYPKGNADIPWYLKNRAIVLCRTNRGEAALKCAKEAADVHKAFVSRVVKHHKASFKKDLKRHPDYAFFLNVRGHCYRECNNLDKALSYYERALRTWSEGENSLDDMPLKVEIVWVLTSIGEIHHEKKKWRKARELYGHAEHLMRRIQESDTSVQDYRHLSQAISRLPDNPALGGRFSTFTGYVRNSLARHFS